MDEAPRHAVGLRRRSVGDTPLSALPAPPSPHERPIALEELLARIRALLRRATPTADGVLRFADVELDPGTREVRRDGERIDLTRTEFNLLELFMLNPRQVLTRSIIFERVWGYDFGFASNSLDVYIGYLRRKTEAGDKARLIHTVRGVGYALREE